MQSIFPVEISILIAFDVIIAFMVPIEGSRRLRFLFYFGEAFWLSRSSFAGLGFVFWRI